MIKESALRKLQSLRERYEELEQLLGIREIISDSKKFKRYSIEYSDLEEVAKTLTFYQQIQEKLTDLVIMQKEGDSEIQYMIKEDQKSLKQEKHKLEERLNLLLLPRDPNDKCNIFLEIRAGTGGDEAAIFAGNLARMYFKYAEQEGWRVETISEHLGEYGGYKELILRIIGRGVYSKFKFESGAHRVQRVPTTESQGRIHTSACTVAILPEVETIESIDIKLADLRIDTYRASGAGGQHVNRTDSAVRITHIPTKVVVECQDERSQHKNKAKALSLLQVKILSIKKKQQQQEQSQTRRNLVGSGDRSERIRTYNFPQGRVTDHRINLTIYQLNEFLEGNLSMIIDPLIREHQLDLMSGVEDG